MIPRGDATPEPLRSLVIMHLAEVSGPSRSLDWELRWLAERGALEVLLPGDGRLRSELDGFARVRALDYAALMVPSGLGSWLSVGRRTIREYRRFRAAIRAASPDLVIVTSALLPSALVGARVEGAPSLLYAGEILDEPRVPTRLRTLAGRALLSLAARSARAIIACSAPVARQYSGRTSASVTTVHPPIDHLRYANGDAERFRRNHGIPDNAQLIVSVGALSHGRGQDVLIRALPAIRRSHPGAHLAIVGEPHPRDVDRQYAREVAELAAAVAPGSVVFTGFEDRVRDAYAAAAVVVNPTRYEAFGRVAFEALLADRPVVSTSAGAIAEVLRDQEDALLVPPDSPGALAAAVSRVLEDGDLARRLPRAGAARVRADLAPERALALFRGAVEDCLNAC